MVMSSHYDDQVYYSPRQIRGLLPFVIEWITNPWYSLPQELDPFMVMDVAAGLVSLEPYHREVVGLYYSANWTEENRASYIGALFHEDEALVRTRLSRAVHKIQEYLGGPRPRTQVTRGTRAPVAS